MAAALGAPPRPRDGGSLYRLFAPKPSLRPARNRTNSYGFRRPEPLPAPAAAEPHPVIRTPAGAFVIPGIARVEAAPHRRGACARRLADRIASRPTAYLPFINALQVPGVTDLRVKFVGTGPLPAAAGKGAA